MRRAAALAALAVLAACDASTGTGTAMVDPTTTDVATTSAPTATLATTTPPTDPPTTTSTTSTSSTSTTSTSTTSTTLLAVADEEVVLGESVEGRPITVIHRGAPSDVDVLVVGVIHGNEAAGAQIVDVLRMLAVPDGVELWLVPSANPDGQAAGDRHNAHGVDLNRNFPVGWGPVAEEGNWEWAGPAPASEPETQAMVALADLVRPDLTLWYHQDLFRISPSTGREGAVRARYAELTGLPLVEVTGGTYTGTASTWSRSIADVDGVGFTVELGDTLSADDARRHADAVLTVASELSP